MFFTVVLSSVFIRLSDQEDLSFWVDFIQKDKMKKLFTLCTCMFLGIVLQAQQEFSEAPVNPAFRKYLDKKEKGMVSVKTAEGYYYGWVPSPVRPVTRSGVALKSKDFPSVYDLRDLGGVTSVKDQGACGSCWAFATYGSMESRWLLEGYGTYDLSEDHLNNCHGFDFLPCEGGSLFISAAMLTRGYGPMSEADDPYSGTADNTCPSGLTPVAYVWDVWWNDTSRAAVKQALMDYGALFASIYMHQPSYENINHTYFYGGPGDESDGGGGHGVVLVGWDDEKITAADHPGAWIVKNSWGNGWGESGYFYMSYEDSVGFYSVGILPERVEYDPNLTISGYDDLGWVTSVGYGDGEDYALVRMMPSADQQVQHIGTYAAVPGTVISLEVYDDFDGDTLTNLLGSIPDQTCSHFGHHVFDLNDPFDIAAQNDYYIRVTYATGSEYPIPMECYEEGYSTNVEISDSGHCWISNRGRSWLPLGKGLVEYDVCVKAYGMIGAESMSANFTARPVEGIVPLAVEFEEQATGNVTSWEWDFNNDGSTDATEQNPTWVYDSPGSYTVRLVVSDGVSRDTCIKENYIRAVDKLGYGWIAYSVLANTNTGPAIVGRDGALINIGNAQEDFIAGADWAYDQWFGVGYYSGDLVSIDTTTGVLRRVGPLGLDTGQPNGLAYDVSTDRMYLNTSRDLYEVDLYTGYLQKVGEIVSSGTIIGMACDSAGHLYGVDIDEDQLYAINKSTGAGTLIGPLGISLDYAQDIAFDRNENILYGTLYLSNEAKATGEAAPVGSSGKAQGGGLYTIDVSSGQATLSAGFGAEVTGFAIPHGMNYSGGLRANFSADTIAGEAPLTVQFTDRSHGNITRWSWDFDGDGQEDASGQNPSFQYMTAGSYTVSLTVGDGTTSHTETKTNYIRVEGLPDCSWDFDASPYIMNFEDTDDLSGWTIIDANADGNTWQFIDDSGPDNTGCAMYSWSLGPADDWLVSRCFDLEGGQNYEVSFYYKAAAQSFPEKLKVFYGEEDDPQALINLVVDLGTIDNTSFLKSASIVSITDSARYYFGWYACSDADMYNLYVDSIMIRKTGSTPLKAAFTASPTQGAAPLRVEFTDQSTGNINSREWDFDGDGIMDATGPAPVYEYTEEGTYTVSLVVSDGTFYDTLTRVDYIQVLEVDKLGYAWDALSFSEQTSEGPVYIGISGEVINLSGNTDNIILSADWAQGKWVGCDAATNNLVTIDTLNGALTVIGKMALSLPTGFAWDVTTGRFYVMDFDDTGSFLYQVDTADAGLVLVGEVLTDALVIGMAFDNEGTLYGINYEDDVLYEINKTTGAASEIGSLGIYVDVFRDLAYDRKNDVLYGTLSLYEGAKNAVLFNLDEKGTKSAGGLYEINMETGQATLLHAFEDVVSGFAIPHSLEAMEEVSADFIAEPTQGYAPLSVQFTDRSSGEITSWWWDFDGDGTNDSELSDPEYEYSATGDYSVRLIVGNGAMRDTLIRAGYITVQETVSADFEADVTSGTVPLTVNFQDLSKGDIVSWNWDMDGDGTWDDTHQNCSHTYDAAGTYSVTLEVTDGLQTHSKSRVDYITVEETTSLEDILAGEQVVVYPNPLTDQTIIQVAEDYQVEKVVLARLNGQVMATWANPDIRSNRISIDFSSFPQGVYLLKIHLENEIVSLRLVVN
jgi:PKD repeat protein/C1A family cysteine protease